jgi:hypothetical protein
MNDNDQVYFMIDEENIFNLWRLTCVNPKDEKTNPQSVGRWLSCVGELFK